MLPNTPSDDAARRIRAAVRAVEGQPVNTVGQRRPALAPAAATIYATITDGADSQGGFTAHQTDYAGNRVREGINWDGVDQPKLKNINLAPVADTGPAGSRVQHRVWRDMDTSGEVIWYFAGYRLGQLFAVDLQRDGGQAGSGTTLCDFTYTVVSLDRRVLGTQIMPQAPRPSRGALRAARRGWAYYRSATGLSLMQTDEIWRDVGGC